MLAKGNRYRSEFDFAGKDAIEIVPKLMLAAG
jgi:hypothetical protein